MMQLQENLIAFALKNVPSQDRIGKFNPAAAKV